jgi:hypothetical protein
MVFDPSLIEPVRGDAVTAGHLSDEGDPLQRIQNGKLFLLFFYLFSIP